MVNKKFISDFVYGSIDGIITTFSIVSGSLGANLSNRIIIILGMSNILSDGFSMASSRYLSAHAEEEMQGKRFPSPLASSLMTFFSFILLGIIPLLAFIFGNLFNEKSKYFYAYLFTGIALFVVGFIKGYIININNIYSGAETLTIGGIASLIAYFVGSFLQNIK